MLSGWDGFPGSDHVVVDAQEVIAVFEAALMRVERPAAHQAALGDDDTGGARFRHGDVGGHRIRFVFQSQHTVLADPHPREQQLTVPAD